MEPVTCRMAAEGETPEQLPEFAGVMFWVTFSGGACDLHEPPCAQHLYVVLPNGSWWGIDGRASNCDSPCATCKTPYNRHLPGHAFIDSKPHHCWVRHGEPPLITVDKDGTTCGAGGGSIQAGDFHGFLRNGVLAP